MESIWDGGERRVRRNKELRGLYRESDIIGIIKSRRLRWAHPEKKKGFNHEGYLGGKTSGVYTGGASKNKVVGSN